MSGFAVGRGKNNIFFFLVGFAYELAAFFKNFFGGNVVLPDGAVVA